MPFIIPNLRLAELVGIVNTNEAFFDDFISYLNSKGYSDLYSFVNETANEKASTVLLDYLQRPSLIKLHDGLGRPYADDSRARWCFLAWLFRDAPSQRLQPLVSKLPGKSVNHQRAYLLNEIRKFVRPLFPKKENWTWAAVSETILARLEGSRRALKGTFFETIVRTSLYTLFTKERIALQVADGQIRLNDETYDIQVQGSKGSILIPVKTRETMGGGHANLFTRDIHKAITAAQDAGFECIPIVIAESWGGDLATLKCKHYVYIQANPNQVEQIVPLLAKKLKSLVSVFRALQ